MSLTGSYRLWGLESKLLKGGYIGDFVGVQGLG